MIKPVNPFVIYNIKVLYQENGLQLQSQRKTKKNDEIRRVLKTRYDQMDYGPYWTSRREPKVPQCMRSNLPIIQRVSEKNTLRQRIVQVQAWRSESLLKR